VTAGRPSADSDGRVLIARIPPVADALDLLAVLADLHARGMCEPPPLASRTSAAYALAARRGGDAVRAATGEWESGFGLPREDAEPEHVLAFGTRTFAELYATPARPDERGAFWDPDEPRRFGRWARRLWDPLLAVEEVRER
jgi:exodeoxyribonuclease V gamma subunit